MDRMLMRAPDAGAAMNIEKDKMKCTECGWIGTPAMTDKVPDPRPLAKFARDIWHICPACRTPENFRSLCDEPGCEIEMSCGTLTPDGYRNTCHRHAPGPK